MNEQVKESITVRYNKLAHMSCCLSCGGAIKHAHIKPGEQCLDLGSGRGQDVIRMAEEAGPSGFAYGIDLSEGMIEKAKKNAHKFNISNLEFIQSELEILPIKDDSIDVVISNCTINHARDKGAVYKEIYRVLKKGGRIVISDIYSLDTVPPEYAEDPQSISECWGGAITKDTYIRVLEEAGFNEVVIVDESEPYDKGKIVVASFTFIAYKR
ncbi:MAG: methyltransferase domain-containing protein [Spirochaetales bacterium]|nr:methyltransferase domain-containing protein [Spirochaetales bacterium]